ncbi:MAG: alpha-L-rhamnosidase N-terminal domain-containing protein [Pirellulaceae bacterium]|nr:alpha-L-rhamnosidase N-terminal domain-containing protein [Pirellulaceae bacterium]
MISRSAMPCAQTTHVPFASLVLLAVAIAVTGHAAENSPSVWSAKWIWRNQADCHAYNQTVIARKQFQLDKPASGRLRITADSYYRLHVNGTWVNDGPSRCWPEHFQYDELDVGSYLRDGANEIRVIARYYGVGDFHRVPKQAGLLAQLEAIHADGNSVTIATDDSWEIADAPAWIRNTPKVSIQMEPAELYDARLAEPLQFAPAHVLFDAQAGPWRDLNPRDVALLTRQPTAPRAFLGAKVVKCEALNFCLPAARLVHPGLIEANNHVSCACGMATILETSASCSLSVQNENMLVAIDGRQAKDGRFELAAGRHLVLAFVRNIFGHDKEKSLRFLDSTGLKLENPLDPAHANPWCFLRFPEYAVVKDDLLWMPFTAEDPALAKATEGYGAATKELLQSVKTVDDFQAKLVSRAEAMSKEAMFVEDVHWQFLGRQEVGDGAGLVESPAALMHESPTVTTVHPSPQGDVELWYDLGEQNVGYFAFDLIADAGVAVDIFSLEYIAPDGRLQHSLGNRNGLRYVTRQGVNEFTSLKRRSGRYVFLTLRNQKTPVRIRNFRLIESTYPLDYVGSFACSDARLDRIWDVSTRTLKLCMEDTFTDCPLYEQTHWVGDARNESLLAYPVFGTTDLARRCIRITAQSLERYPIAGCQTPSSWDVLIPAWSFLWGISVWDYYWYTGDAEAVREFWPAVIQNLQGAERYVNDQDLFSAPFWNFFDWTPIDSNQKTVLHNSMFVVGAIDAALKTGQVLDDHRHDAWLQSLRQRLVRGVNRLWDDKKQAYPDSVRGDGSISPSTCQHTSFLAVLFDMLESRNLAAAQRNLLNPPEGMVRVGSPFAALYQFEAMEKMGLEDEIVQEIYRNYLPMLEAGATTVWESFPSGTTGGGQFPTRSHCHAWSSAPNYFLPRIVLGVKATAPGTATAQISPHLTGLTWAQGRVATARGTISVAWRLQDDRVEITATAPAGVTLRFARNASLNGKQVVFNGQVIE